MKKKTLEEQLSRSRDRAFQLVGENSRLVSDNEQLRFEVADLKREKEDLERAVAIAADLAASAEDHLAVLRQALLSEPRLVEALCEAARTGQPLELLIETAVED